MLKQETEAKQCKRVQKLTSGVTLEKSSSLWAQLFIMWKSNLDVHKTHGAALNASMQQGHFPAAQTGSGTDDGFILSCTERQTQTLEIS